MIMPRLSLYRPEKGKDYKFIDKTIWEMFQVGGTDVLVHKYLGPASVPAWSSEETYTVDSQVSINNRVYKCIKKHTGFQPPNSTYWEFVREGTPSQPVYTEDDPFQIQDLLFLENRDRKYDPDIFVLRGVYNVQDIDFNLSQFGLFLQNDTIFISFHINDTVEKIGRKLIAGDVIELPHLKDEYALNDLTFALKRFYVIEEVSRAAEGFSVTWYPHLYRAKCKPLVDSQEFKDILDGVADSDNFLGPWREGVTYFPGDVVTGPDGQNYTCIDPEGIPYLETGIYYPGDVILYTDGQKYIVVNKNIPTWDGTKTYQPGDTVTGPDGRIYQVLDNEDTANGITAILPPESDFWEAIQGTGVTGVDPSSSDRYEIINVTADGITDVFPPNTTYWEISETLRDIVSTYEKELQITQAVLDQAEDDAPRSGYDTTKYYHMQKGEDGRPELVSADSTDLDTSLQTQATDENGNPLTDENGNPVYLNPTPSTVLQTVEQQGYNHYLFGDAIPPNGAPFSAGISFPITAVEGQFCLRTDYMPNRLFRFNGKRWVRIEDNVRMTMSNMSGFDDTNDRGLWNQSTAYVIKDMVKFGGDYFVAKKPNQGVPPSTNPLAWQMVRQTQKTSFINNNKVSTINGHEVKEKQSLSQALRPKADE